MKQGPRIYYTESQKASRKLIAPYLDAAMARAQRFEPALRCGGPMYCCATAMPENS